MALLGEIKFENTDKITLRPGSVVADVIIEKDYLQLRTYAMGEKNKERGSKQNIQFSREKAKEFIKILQFFLDK